MCGLVYAKITKSYRFMDADQKKAPKVLNYLLVLSEIHWQASAGKVILFKEGAGEAAGSCYEEQCLKPAEA